MKEYGYINEAGYLTSREFEDSVIPSLDPQWKPVDTIDPEKLHCTDNQCRVKVVAYDAGDHIAYSYNTVFDKQKLRREIESRKQELSDSDYKIVKCYEASLLNKPLPYNVEELHQTRQQMRNEINELELQAANA
jgi:hypothetical protein